MGSIAVGFGTMLTAPSKALYSVAVKHRKTTDVETMSVQSKKLDEFPLDPVKRPVLHNILGGVSMQRSQSDHSSFVAPPFEHANTIDARLKRDLGSKGLGRVLKSTVEGNIAKEPTMTVAPVDFSMAMAQGWHNLPSLYGQKVRKIDPIKDFSSGVKEGGKVASQLSVSHVSNSDLGSTTESRDSSWSRSKVAKRKAV
jgi:hypothetical protein